jgi:IS1 family transposase
MANVLNRDKQIAVVAALAEGMAIRQIERMTNIHRDTIMRLGVRIGKGCARVMDERLRNLDCQEIQVDEVWGFIGKKQKHLTPDDDHTKGDVWTFCAVDADSKLVPSFKVGKRTSQTANAFIADLASRLMNRVQLSSDALIAYADAVERGFGSAVDYGQIVKSYETIEGVNAQRRYSPPELVRVSKSRIIGRPNPNLISTSYVERLNATTRHHVKRLARLTLAFSKKRENFEAAVALHFAYYNFVRVHRSIRCTPAQAANVEQSIWSVGDLVEQTA